MPQGEPRLPNEETVHGVMALVHFAGLTVGMRQAA